MSDLYDRIRQFKHLIGDGKLVAMATFIEVHDDGADERCIELHLAFEDQTLNPRGTGSWIVNSTTVSPGDDWQEICDGAIDAAEEFYTDLLKFRGGAPHKKDARPSPDADARHAWIVLNANLEAETEVSKLIASVTAASPFPVTTRKVTDECVGMVLWETWILRTKSLEEARALLDKVCDGLVDEDGDSRLATGAQWLGCVISDQSDNVPESVRTSSGEGANR